MRKGCGGGSWGFEWEESHGHNVIDRLREGLIITLKTIGKEQGVQWDEKQIHHAVNHAYQIGGGKVCADCWHHTLPTDAYQTCPLYLYSERITWRTIEFRSNCSSSPHSTVSNQAHG